MNETQSRKYIHETGASQSGLLYAQISHPKLSPPQKKKNPNNNTNKSVNKNSNYILNYIRFYGSHICTISVYNQLKINCMIISAKLS